MGERIELATMDDLDDVVEFLILMHEDLQEFGGEVLRGDKTYAYLRSMAIPAIEGRGVCLIVRDEFGPFACLLATEMEYPYDHAMGKVAIGLGTWVDTAERGRGWATQLYARAREVLHNRGFKTYNGAYLVANKRIQKPLQANGSRDIEMIMRFPLGE